MKKLFTLVLLFATSSYANAKDGFFMGADVNHSYAKHAISVSSQSDIAAPDYSYNSFDENKTDKKNTGISFNAGYKKYLDNIKYLSNIKNIFIAPEIFFDQLNNSAADPYANDSGTSNKLLAKQDRIILKYRYGAKLNIGYTFAKKYNVFANAGLTNNAYSIEWNDNIGNNSGKGELSSYGATKIAAIYGIGFSYNFNDHWSVKTTYDHQRFNIRYNLDGWRSRVNLNVLKVGVGYSF